MRHVIRNILFVAVIALYVFSTMGYGVHKCTSDGSASLVILFAETLCVHQDVCGDQEGCCHHHHSEEEDNAGENGCSSHSRNCCSTDVYVLSQDQAPVQDDFEIQLPMAGSFMITPCLMAKAANAVPFLFRLGTADTQKRVEDAPQALLCTFRV